MPTPFLSDPDPSSLLQAAGNNQRVWMARMALAAGGEVRETDAVTWTYSPRPKGYATLAFPHFREDDAGDRVDAFLDFCRAHRPLRSVACWTEISGEPADLGARLVARGFHWGWQAHWMALDMEGKHFPIPDTPDAHIGEAPDGADWTHDAVCEGQAEVSYKRILTRESPRRVWLFTATVGNQVMGHCTLNVTDGPLGVGGIYDLGLARSLQGRKIGLAMMNLASSAARDLGCRFLTLNSINDSFYAHLGYRSLGYGQTWWMGERDGGETLTFPPPSPEAIALVEAVGRGDVAALEALDARPTPEELSAPILGRHMTLRELATEMNQPASIAWLAAQGVLPPKAN